MNAVQARDKGARNIIRGSRDGSSFYSALIKAASVSLNVSGGELANIFGMKMNSNGALDFSPLAFIRFSRTHMSAYMGRPPGSHIMRGYYRYMIDLIADQGPSIVSSLKKLPSLPEWFKYYFVNTPSGSYNFDDCLRSCQKEIKDINRDSGVIDIQLAREVLIEESILLHIGKSETDFPPVCARNTLYLLCVKDGYDYVQYKSPGGSSGPNSNAGPGPGSGSGLGPGPRPTQGHQQAMNSLNSSYAKMLHAQQVQRQEQSNAQYAASLNARMAAGLDGGAVRGRRAFSSPRSRYLGRR